MINQGSGNYQSFDLSLFLNVAPAEIQKFKGEIKSCSKQPQFSMLHGAAITGDKEMLQKLLKSSYFDKSAIDIRHCVIFFRLLCPLKNQNYPDHGMK